MRRAIPQTEQPMFNVIFCSPIFIFQGVNLLFVLNDMYNNGAMPYQYFKDPNNPYFKEAIKLVQPIDRNKVKLIILATIHTKIYTT